MSENLKILHIKGTGIQLGIMVTEINKIIPYDLKSPAPAHTLRTFFADETDTVDSLASIFAQDSELMLGIPGETEILNVPLTAIMLLPPFLRKKQNPFFCWGFFKQEEELVMLITFSRVPGGLNG